MGGKTRGDKIFYLSLKTFQSQVDFAFISLGKGMSQKKYKTRTTVLTLAIALLRVLDLGKAVLVKGKSDS